MTAVDPSPTTTSPQGVVGIGLSQNSVWLAAVTDRTEPTLRLLAETEKTGPKQLGRFFNKFLDQYRNLDAPQPVAVLCVDTAETSLADDVAALVDTVIAACAQHDVVVAQTVDPDTVAGLARQCSLPPSANAGGASIIETSTQAAAAVASAVFALVQAAPDTELSGADPAPIQIWRPDTDGSDTDRDSHNTADTDVVDLVSLSADDEHAAAVAPGNRAPTTASTEPSHSSTFEARLEELADTQTQLIAEHEASVAALNAILADERSERDALQAEHLSHMQAVADAHEAALAELTGEHQQAHDALIAQIDQHEADARRSESERSADHERDVAALRQAHQQTLDDIASTHQNELAERDTARQAELADLTTNHQNELAERDTEAAALRESLSAAEAEKHNMVAAHAEQTEVLQQNHDQATTTALTSHTEAIDALRSERDALDASLATALAQRGDARQLLADATTKRDELARQLGTTEAKHAEAAAQLAETSANLEAKSAAHEELSVQAEELGEDLRATRHAHQRVAEQLAQSKQAATELAVQHAAAIEELENENARAIATLHGEHQHLIAAALSEHAAAVEALHETNREQASAGQRERAALEATHQQAVTSLNDDLLALEAKVAEHQAQVQAGVAECDRLTTELAATRSANSEMVAGLHADHDEALRAVNGELASTQETVASTQGALVDERSASRELKRALAEERRLSATLDASARQLSSESASALERITELTQSLVEAESEGSVADSALASERALREEDRQRHEQELARLGKQRAQAIAAALQEQADESQANKDARVKAEADLDAAWASSHEEQAGRQTAEKEVERLRGLLEKIQARAAAADTHAVALKAEHREHVEQLMNGHGQAVERLQQRHETALKQASQAVADGEKMLGDARQRSAHRINELELLAQAEQAATQELRSELDVQVAANKKLSERSTQLAESLQQLEADATTAETRREQLQAEISVLQQRVRGLTTQREELVAQTKNQGTELHQLNSSLEQQGQGLSESQATIEELRQRIADHQDAERVSATQMADLNEQLDRLRDELAQAVENTKQAVDVERATAAEQVAALQARLDLAAASAEAALEKERVKANDRAMALQARIDSTVVAAKETAQQERSQAAAQANEFQQRLDAAIASSKQEVDKVRAEAEIQAKAMQTRLDSATNLVETERKRVTDAKGRIAELDANIATLDKARRASDEQAKQARQEIADLTERAASLDHSHALEKQKAFDAGASLGDRAAERAAQLEQEVDRLRDRLSAPSPDQP